MRAACAPWLSTEVLSAVVKTLVESVAVKPQVPVDVMVTALKVATPATATAAAVPPRVQPAEGVSVTVSIAPVPLDTTLPYVSSIETLKVVNTAD